MNICGNQQNQRGRKRSQKDLQINFELDATELMFFPKTHDGRPTARVPSSGEEFHRKKNYLEKIRPMSSSERRKHRAERDLRYLHQKSNKNVQPDGEVLDESKKLCAYHLTGPCNLVQCNRIHQMRTPRIFGVCKFYLTGICAKGDFCEYMHSDFPCRFYYLDLQHRNHSKEDECRLCHGGPLPQRLRQHFLKHISCWVKKLTERNPEEYEEKLNEFVNRFETKQLALANASKDSSQNVHTSPIKAVNEWCLEQLLSTKQIQKLADHQITTIVEIHRTPVDKLEELGLTVDQIYQITLKACEELKDSIEMEVIEEDLCMKIDTPESDESNSTPSPNSDFLGFSPNNSMTSVNDDSLEKSDIENKAESDSAPDATENFVASTSQVLNTTADDSMETDDSDSEALVINENENEC